LNSRTDAFMRPLIVDVVTLREHAVRVREVPVPMTWLWRRCGRLRAASRRARDRSHPPRSGTLDTTCARHPSLRRRFARRLLPIQGAHFDLWRTTPVCVGPHQVLRLLALPSSRYQLPTPLDGLPLLFAP
jgi:hypothetical protein